MDLGIAGRTAVVCASSKGLGKGCAAALAEAGCRVVINGRDERSLELARSELAALGGEIVAVAADVGTPEGRQALLEAAGAVDILVNNNAGPPFKDFRELDHDALGKGVEANMLTPILMIQLVIEGMQSRRFGRIVNLTSSSVKAPIPGLDLSSGARAGLTAFVAGVARTVASDNVTINNIMPGQFDTDRLRSSLERTAKSENISIEAARERALGKIPAGRFGSPEEFGRLCAYLCSAGSSYITGQSILIDGGQTNTTL